MRRTLVLVGALVTALILFAAPASASYWFFQQYLIGPITKYRDAAGTQYVRISFDNTVHQGHTQRLVLINTSNQTSTINISCPTGSGCDSGSLAINGNQYPNAGCGNPQSYPVWTNCRYGTGP
ncbi:MAG TPA: hypothetical protein VF101_04740 [Gaiellaceae bacterium]